MDKNMPANARTQFEPWSWKIQHATEQLWSVRHNYKPDAAVTEACVSQEPVLRAIEATSMKARAHSNWSKACVQQQRLSATKSIRRVFDIPF